VNEQKSFREGAADGGGPVSKPELDRLRARRESPAPLLDYRLGEPTGKVMRKLDVIRARRAHHIESRLRESEGRAETDFALAGVAGHAKREFDRSR
jgi:hypothetical protein